MIPELDGWLSSRCNTPLLRRVGAFLLLIVCLGVPGLARAEAAPLAESLTGVAKAEYAGARILYEDGDYQGALTKLESAYNLSKDPRLLWNMAACEKQLRRYARVVGLLQRYQTEGAHLMTDDDRASAQEFLSTVKAFVNELHVKVEPDGAQIFIDGDLRGTAPLSGPLLVDMGKRLLEVRAQEHVSHQRELELAGGKSLTLHLSLQPVVHQGSLRIVSEPSAVLRVDGRVVGTASWSGTLDSGEHNVEVSAPDKLPYQTRVLVKDNEESVLHINLQAKPVVVQMEGSSAWWWIAGGVLAAGAGVGGYYLFKPGQQTAPAPVGTWGGWEL